MKPLKYTLILKIIFTIVIWAMPSLFAPKDFLESLGFPKFGGALIFLRLLGAAYVALTVGYIFGLIKLRKGKYPNETVWIGIVSNGLACLFLVIAAVNGVWRESEWEDFARGYMWFSLVATGGITVCLVKFGILRK